MTDIDSANTNPRISVVIPVHNGGHDLEKCLAAVRASSYPVFECIVVDDASTDDMTQPVAEKFAARIIRLDEQCGPAQARNQGAAQASGEIIFFTDTDVLLYPDALAQAVTALQADTEVSAVFGSYDDQPGHNSFISQYRNLLHHWVHQTSSEEASTFWTGCGAIYREVFVKMGGFDSNYSRPSIEDIELGVRLRESGHRIRLNKAMLGKHMKHWKLWGMIRTDIFQRGVPWMLLILSKRWLPNDLNLSHKSRLATLLAGLLGLLTVILLLTGHATALVPMAALMLGASGGTWYSKTGHDRKRETLFAAALALFPPLACLMLIPEPLALVPVAIILTIAATHLAFYRYVAGKRNVAFAISIVPMHVMFFLCCAASVPIAFVKHLTARDSG